MCGLDNLRLEMLLHMLKKSLVFRNVANLQQFHCLFMLINFFQVFRFIVYFQKMLSLLQQKQRKEPKLAQFIQVCLR